MIIVKREEYERNKGEELGQFLAGACGAMVTTLPSFIVMPLWAFFVAQYKVVDAEGKDNDAACFFVCLLAGALVWLLLALAVGLAV